MKKLKNKDEAITLLLMAVMYTVGMGDNTIYAFSNFY